MGNMPVLGILASSLSDEFTVQVASGVHAIAREHGYHVLGIEATPAGVHEQQLATRTVAGWIAIHTAEGLDALAVAGTPAVQISCSNAQAAYPNVQPDNRPGARAMVQHLIEHGHERIAFVGALFNPDIHERVQIYEEVLTANGIAPDPALRVGTTDYSPDSTDVAVRALLGDGLVCSAIMFGNDQHALAGMATIAALGYRVPADIAVVGFDDINAAQYGTPPLTTVRQSAVELGREAAVVLLDQLAGRPPRLADIRVPTAPVLRQSCGCGLPALQGEDAPAHAAGSWTTRLASQLSAMLQPSALNDPAAPPAPTWPGAETLVNGLAAAITGEDHVEPDQPALLQAWLEAMWLRGTIDTLVDMYQLMEESAAQQVGDASAGRRVRRFLGIAHRLMTQSVVQVQRQEVTSLTNLLWANYDLGAGLVSGRDSGTLSLQWMERQPIQAGCLARWDAGELVIESTYDRNDPQLAPPGARYAAATFPPAELFAAAAEIGTSAYVVLVPIQAEGEAWGLLAFGNDDVQHAIIGVYTTSIWSVLLGGAFERAALEARVRQERATLQSAYQRERQLTDAVRALGSPVIPLLPQVLLVPLIGAIDQGRVQHALETVLNSVSRVHATHVLVDITGVAMIDLPVAEGLIQLVSAAKLLGAEVVLVGIRPEIAQHLTSLGSDLRFLRTYSTLATAVQRLLSRA